jgi:hypothetical protein
MKTRLRPYSSGHVGLQVHRFPDNKDKFRPTAIAEASTSAIKSRDEMTLR